MTVPCEIYSRVSGYYRPVAQWNKGKREEFKEREFCKVPEEVLSEQDSNRSLMFDGSVWSGKRLSPIRM